jgi:hypothetical protein
VESSGNGGGVLFGGGRPDGADGESEDHRDPDHDPDEEQRSLAQERGHSIAQPDATGRDACGKKPGNAHVADGTLAFAKVPGRLESSHETRETPFLVAMKARGSVFCRSDEATAEAHEART